MRCLFKLIQVSVFFLFSYTALASEQIPWTGSAELEVAVQENNPERYLEILKTIWRDGYSPDFVFEDGQNTPLTHAIFNQWPTVVEWILSALQAHKFMKAEPQQRRLRVPMVRRSSETFREGAAATKRKLKGKFRSSNPSRSPREDKIKEKESLEASQMSVSIAESAPVIPRTDAHPRPHVCGNNYFFLAVKANAIEVETKLRIIGAIYEAIPYEERAEAINSLDEHGWSALHYAVRSRDERIVLWLIQHGADVNQLSSFGISPYVLAQQHELSSLMRLLIYHGASVPLSITLDPEEEQANSAESSELNIDEVTAHKLVEILAALKNDNNDTQVGNEAPQEKKERHKLEPSRRGQDKGDKDKGREKRKSQRRASQGDLSVRTISATNGNSII